MSDDSWQDNVIKMIRKYNKLKPVFNDKNGEAKKTRFILEDRRIRFFEFADDIIENDVFGDDEIKLKPPRRGRGPSRKKLEIDIPDDKPTKIRKKVEII